MIVQDDIFKINFKNIYGRFSLRFDFSSEVDIFSKKYEITEIRLHKDSKITVEALLKIFTELKNIGTGCSLLSNSAHVYRFTCHIILFLSLIWSRLFRVGNPMISFSSKETTKGYIIKADKVLKNLEKKNAFWGPKTFVSFLQPFEVM